MDRSPDLISLDDRMARDPAIAGQKAARLARLRALSMAVPDGVVLTTAACSRITGAPAQSRRGRVGIAPRIRFGPVEKDAIEASVARLGKPQLAIRSSGVAEDLDSSSYAGQYITVLGVRGVDEIADAIARCLESSQAGLAR